MTIYYYVDSVFEFYIAHFLPPSAVYLMGSLLRKFKAQEMSRNRWFHSPQIAFASIINLHSVARPKFTAYPDLAFRLRVMTTFFTLFFTVICVMQRQPNYLKHGVRYFR